ncbi:hypothetical protein [Paenibacillus sp. CMAA1364]
MTGEKEMQTDTYANVEIDKKRNVDILKIMEQCNIHPDRWNEYTQVE